MNIALWIAQFFLAFSLFYSGGTKAFVPMDVLAAQWPSIGALAPPMVRLLGVIDMLGAIGLIVPAILRIKPALTVIAAWDAFRVSGLQRKARSEERARTCSVKPTRGFARDTP
jgi:hypothetical protein